MSNTISLETYRQRNREELEAYILKEIAKQLKRIHPTNEWAAEERITEMVDVICGALAIPNYAAKQEAVLRERFPEVYARKDAERKQKKLQRQLHNKLHNSLHNKLHNREGVKL